MYKRQPPSGGQHVTSYVYDEKPLLHNGTHGHHPTLPLFSTRSPASTTRVRSAYASRMSATSARPSPASATASPCRAAPIASSPERPCCKALPLPTLHAQLTNSGHRARRAGGDDAAAAQRAVGIAAWPPARARFERARHRGREERLSAESRHCIYTSCAESAAPLARQLSLRTRAFFSLASCVRARGARMHACFCISAAVCLR